MFRPGLRKPERELQAERHRLGVHAVGPADHRRAAVLQRPVPDRRRQPVEVRQDEIARFAHLQRLRGIDHVRRGHTEVEPAGGRSDVFGDRGRERDDVVLGGAFDLFDARDVERALLADVAGRLDGHEAGGGHGLGGRRLDEQPGLVATLVAPDPAHVGVRVACDHERSAQVQSPGRNLQPVHVAQHGRGQRPVLEEIARPRAGRRPT